MEQLAATKNHADDLVPGIEDGASFATQRTRTHEPRASEPRIVVCEPEANDADAALKKFIHEWFVPALVEAYIRDRMQPPAQKCKDSDGDSQQ